MDPQIVACTMLGSGLRIFDIRDPARPREVAYHIQPQTAGADPSERGAYAMSGPAFAPERREVWYTDIDTGFFNVKLSPAAWPQSTGTAVNAAPEQANLPAAPAGAAVGSAPAATPAGRRLPTTGAPITLAPMAIALLAGAAALRRRPWQSPYG